MFYLRLYYLYVQATFHFLVPVYVYDLYGRESKLKLDGILWTQFAFGCLYQYVMSELKSVM